MTKHTPEPWTIVRSRGYLYDGIGKNNDCAVFEEARESDALRIVQCVNACAGMSDPEKEITELRQRIKELESCTK